jgi:hypothetical protein
MAKKKDKEVTEEVKEKKKKKKVKKVDVAQNFLYCILGLMLGLFALMGMCIASPEFSNMIVDLATSVKNAPEPEIIVKVEEPEGEEGEGEEGEKLASAEGEGADSEEGSSVTVETAEENEVKSTEAAASPQEIKPIVTITDPSQVVIEDETTDEEASEPIVVPTEYTGKSDYVDLEPDIVDIDSKEQAEQITRQTGYGNTGDGLSFDAAFYPYYNMLDEKSKALYRQVYANAMDLNAAFKPVEQMGMLEIENVISSVAYDHPELFWLDTTFYTEYDFSGTAIKLELTFYERLGDIGSARLEFDAAAEAVVAAAATLPTTIEKEAFVHNYLADKLTYKHNSLDQSAYSGIVDNYTVCAGYAKSFQYLMQRLGVPTYLCVGRGANELHAWNVINLDGAYYNVDCTWDDQDPVIYDFFNVNDDDNYYHTRMFQSVNLPRCMD